MDVYHSYIERIIGKVHISNPGDCFAGWSYIDAAYVGIQDNEDQVKCVKVY